MKGNVQLIRLIGSFQEEAEEHPWVSAEEQKHRPVCLFVFKAWKQHNDAATGSQMEKRYTRQRDGRPRVCSRQFV